MPRPWENVKELYPGYIEEVYGPEKASDGTTREEFYDKMVANGWNKPGDDDLIVAMYLRTALHFEREDRTKPIDSLVFVELEKSNGSDPESRKQTIDRCRNLFTDSTNKELIKGAHLLELESKHLDFVVQMRKKGWTHEGDDKIIDMLYALPNNFLAGSITESFRENICLASSGNSVESRRSLLKKVVSYINYDIREYEKEEHSNTLEALEKELEKHDKLILLDNDNYKKASQRMGEAELAYKKSKITQKLNDFMNKNDVVGAANYILELKARETHNHNKNINDPKTAVESDTIDEWLIESFDAANEGRLYKEGQLFLFDLHAETQRRICESQIKLGQLIEAQEKRIRQNPPKNSELLIDNPKIVSAMAKEYVIVHSKHDDVVDYDVACTLLSQLEIGIIKNKSFDRSVRPVKTMGVSFKPSDTLIGSEQAVYVGKYNAMITQQVADRHPELSDEKKKKYLTAELTPRLYLGERYHVDIRKGENGELEISKLSDDINKMSQMSVQELYKMREKEQKLLAVNETIKPISALVGSDFEALYSEFKGFMNKNHPAWSKCKPVYDLLDQLRNTGGNTAAYNTVKTLDSLIEAVNTYKENYGGDILNEGGRRNDFMTKVSNKAERARANLRGLVLQAEGKSFIDRDISTHKETIRRIDKQLQIKNAHPAPDKKVGFVPDPGTQLEDILEAVNNAEAAVWKSSNEYKRANRSLIELDRALKEYNNTPVGLKNLRKNRLENIKTIVGQTRTNIKSYFDRKRRQGLYYGGADNKTQRRIDIMLAANRCIDACERFANDRIGEIDYVAPAYNDDAPVEENINVPVYENKEAMHFIYGDFDESNAEQIEQEQAPNEDRQERFEKLDIAPEHRETISEKADRSRLDNFVEKQEQARKEAAEKALKEQQEREERAKNPVDIDKELKSAQDAISKLKNEGEDINSPKYDKHLSTIVTCIKILKYRKNANAFETVTGEEFDSIDQNSTLSNPTFEKMLKQTKREDLIEQATYDKGQNLFSNYSHTSDQIKEEKRKLKEESKKLEEEKRKLEEESDKLMDKAAALGDAVEPQSFFRRKMK